MSIDIKTVNNIRVLACETISNANSGHSGIVLGSAPILYTLFAKHINVVPHKPLNILRDKFVMSAGHGSALLYTTLHAMGYDISSDDLKKFRKLDSKTPGHPELCQELGVECTTGPLGQGVATAVGMALADKMMGARFNKPNCKLFDNKVYALIGDGCLMEGVALEALSFAGNLCLDNLVVLYDSNDVSLDSRTDKTFALNTEQIMQGMGFNVIKVNDGNSVQEIDIAIQEAKKSLKPSFIIIKTHIGFGSAVQNTNKAHGLVLNQEGLNDLKKVLRVDNLPFEFEREVQNHLIEVQKRFKIVEKNLNGRISEYHKLYKTEYKELIDFYNENYRDAYKYLINLDQPVGKSTREMGGSVLNALAEKYSQIIGGTADLSSSTKAYIKNGNDVSKLDFSGRNILYGVREFAMACITNGLALSDFMPFASTFLVFSDYMKSAIRSSALMKLPVTYILTHDSIAVGEDGPTHEPIEQLSTFRSVPNLAVFRPCNYEETCFAYAYPLINRIPSIIALTRQNLPIISAGENAEDVVKGGYVISREVKSELHAVLVATGSEVQLAISAQKLLLDKGFNVRVVSMPCVEVFESQPKKYKEKVLPSNFSAVVTVESGSTQSWFKYAGKTGACIGIDEFGASAPQDVLFKKYDITIDRIVKETVNVINKNRTKTYSVFN